MVIFDDTEKDEKIRIIAAGAKIELLAEEKKIVVDGDNIVINANKRIDMKANEISLEAKDGTINIKSKNLTLSSDNKTEITATDELTLKGKSVGLN